MVLYHAITTYHILEFILHRLIYHPNEKSICLLPEFMYERPGLAEQLVKSEFFTQVIQFRYRTIPHDKNLIFQKTDNFVKNLLPDISEFDEINVAGAQYYFSNWLIHENIPFNFWEEASGRITKTEPVRYSVKCISPIQDEVTESNNMYDGKNATVLKRYCNFKAQLESFDFEKAVDFDPINEIGKLTEDQKISIFKFFNAPTDLNFSEHSITILTQHFANLNMMTFEEQAELYQLTRDYFLNEYTNEELIFKSHPEDIMFYEYLFEGCKVIREKFPSELIPFISPKRSETVMAISSTGISNISDNYQRTIVFNAQYEKSFHYNHRYYFAVKALNLFDGDIYAINVNKEQMEYMLKNDELKCNKTIEYCDELPERENCMVIIGDQEGTGMLERASVIKFIENLPENSAVIFLNTDNEFVFYDYELRNDLKAHLLTKHIDVIPIKEDIYAVIGTEKVFIYTKSEKLRKEIQHMSYEKNCGSAGVQTRVSDWSDEETKLAAVEGILDATEKRLLYYIRREKELLMQLEKND